MAHEPGLHGGWIHAWAHLAAITPLLKRADKLEDSGRFRWYTMTQLATFSQRRVETSWSSTSAGGVRTFNASHPASLADVTWLLPRSRYEAPKVTLGSGRVTSDSANWLVTADAGSALRFTAGER